jgi:chitinase
MFTFSNTPPNPGTNTITATDGSLSTTAAKTWFNTPPNCSAVAADITTLWPPNHKLWTITVSGATDPDIGDSATLVVNAITQDEPVNDLGDGDTSPDGFLSSPASNKAQVRAERSGLLDGRVYRLGYVATDTHGATCSGFVTVGVPHDQGGMPIPIDSAPPSFNSLLP